MARYNNNRQAWWPLRCLALVALLSAAWWLCWTLLLWWRWHPQLPWRDLFVILDDLRPLLQGGSAGEWAAFLLQPHYAAHRIALPRLLVAADLQWFGAHNLLLYLTGWSGLLLLWLLPLRLARQALGGAAPSWWFLVGIAGLFLFAPAHLWNLANGINTAWHLSLALAVGALVLLVSPRQPPTLTRWLLAYLLATLSAFATFSGVILWLLLPVFALTAGRRTFSITLVASVLLTAAYLQGIASDASVAVRWQAGDPELARQARQLGADALAANTPWRIIYKACTVLGWPLAANWPAAAVIVVALSLLAPLLAAWQAGRNLLAGRGWPHPWVSLCLALAALTAGTALAIQLGRVMEQPNYAHGPSYERYTTVAALYWCSVTGLVLSWLQRRSRARQAAGMAGLLLLGWMLIAPLGSYLQQEMESLQTAARLYAAGENPALRRRKGKTPSRFKPDYVYSFDDLFQPLGAAYRRPAALPAPAAQPRACAELGVAVRPAPALRRGLRQLEASVDGALQFLVRDILLADDGVLLARLVPVYSGPAAALTLPVRQDTVWRGELRPGVASGQAPRLVLALPAGITRQCSLADADMAALRLE